MQTSDWIWSILIVFLETFKNQEKQPGLILKTNGATFSVIDREEILDKIDEVNNDSAVYHQKIRPLDPKETNGQYCFIKVIIKQKGDTIVKEEIMECADGRKRFDGPSYWDLFAMFYYHDTRNPQYCRYYSRPGHAFKSFGKMCLQPNGKWEVTQWLET